MLQLTGATYRYAGYARPVLHEVDLRVGSARLGRPRRARGRSVLRQRRSLLCRLLHRGAIVEARQGERQCRRTRVDENCGRYRNLPERFRQLAYCAFGIDVDADERRSRACRTHPRLTG